MPPLAPALHTHKTSLHGLDHASCQTHIIRSATVNAPLHRTNEACATCGSTVPIRTKKLTFDEVVRARKTLHINNYTSEEANSTWYSPEEYASIQHDVKFEVDMIEAGILPEKDHSEKYCRRGLESFSTVSKKQKRRARSMYRSLVLDHQYENNGDMLARRCEDLSGPSRVTSRALGLKDEMEALLS